ncbi:MAG TPA: LysM peptidoglycan-binding domain-containing protein [Gemmatimonadaceae bacterium]|jgi:nucleoid-associated protein YgaU|nr:LysM peptidoglycan-binding domain-containing protein [Gemmatimonadaceae bacterium]
MTFSNDNPNPNADFSDVGGSSSTGNSSGTGGTADFSDVSVGGSSTATGGGTTYVVKKGDNLSKIAKHFYGDPGKWKKIHAANSDKIPNPDLIHPGLQLTIPEA